MDEYADYVEIVARSWDDVLSGRVDQLEAYWALEVAVGKALLLPCELAIASELSLENADLPDNLRNAESDGTRPKLYEQSTMIDFINDSRSFSGFEEIVPSPINHNRVNQSLLLPDKDDEDDCSESRIESPTPIHEKHASEESPKAPSKLIMSMFPLLAKTYEKKKSAINSESTCRDDEIDALRTKVKELESKVKTLKCERKDWRIQQQRLKDLNNEKKMFQASRASELEAFTAWKDEELRKLKREKIIWEKQKKLFEVIPTKKERDEIVQLTKQVGSLNNDIKAKERRFASSQDRLKKIIDDLTIRNSELLDEIRILEQDRARSLQQQMDVKVPIQIKKRTPLSNMQITQNIDMMKKKSPKQLDTNLKLIHPQKKHLIFETPLSQKMSSSSSNPALVQSPSISEPIYHMRPKCSPSTPKTSLSRAKIQELETHLQLGSSIKEIYSGGKIQRLYNCGTKLEAYETGVTKEIRSSGVIKLRFLNGDTKEIFHTHETYYFSEQHILVTKYPDGTVVDEFEDGQTVKKFADGRVMVQFPDKTIKYTDSHGREEIIYPNGDIRKRSRSVV